MHRQVEYQRLSKHPTTSLRSLVGHLVASSVLVSRRNERPTTLSTPGVGTDSHIWHAACHSRCVQSVRLRQLRVRRFLFVLPFCYIWHDCEKKGTTKTGRLHSRNRKLKTTQTSVCRHCRESTYGAVALLTVARKQNAPLPEEKSPSSNETEGNAAPTAREANFVRKSDLIAIQPVLRSGGIEHTIFAEKREDR